MNPTLIQRIYRILAEALIVRKVPAQSVAGIATMGAFADVIREHIQKHCTQSKP